MRIPKSSSNAHSTFGGETTPLTARKESRSKKCCSIDNRTCMAVFGVLFIITGYAEVVAALSTNRNVSLIIQGMGTTSIGTYMLGCYMGAQQR